jgi:hypothetical protein
MTCGRDEGLEIFSVFEMPDPTSHYECTNRTMNVEHQRELLKDLLPLLEFQKDFKHEHGRRAQDREYPETLKPLLHIFEENKELLLQHGTNRPGDIVALSYVVVCSYS